MYIHHVCSCQQENLIPHCMQADMAILDEIDSGLDIDALRDVAKAVNALRKSETGVLMVTHYKVRGVLCMERLCDERSAAYQSSMPHHT